MAISITNQKVAGFIPLWSEFRGFSLLFDNPSDSLSLRGDGAAQDRIKKGVELPRPYKS